MDVGRAGNLSVQRHCGFEGDKGQAGADVLRKALVEAPGLGLQDSDLDFDSGGAQLLKSFSGDQRIGIFHAADDARDSGGDHGIGARAGASGVRAGLQIEVERVAARQRARLLHGQHLGVLQLRVDMRAAADDAPALIDNHGAHQRIGRGKTVAARRQLQSLPEKQFIG